MRCACPPITLSDPISARHAPDSLSRQREQRLSRSPRSLPRRLRPRLRRPPRLIFELLLVARLQLIDVGQCPFGISGQELIGKQEFLHRTVEALHLDS